MQSLLLTLLASLCLSVCTPPGTATTTTTTTTKPAPQAAAPEVSEVAKNYKRLQSMTPQPVSVDPVVSMLCIGASPRDTREAYGPHAHTTVSIYMTDDAAKTFKASATPYPTGSIIVKEKKPRGVGGMIKRPPGYDPDHGDWEYFYFEDPAKIESGKIPSCIQCHTAAVAKDHVFGAWSHGG